MDERARSLLHGADRYLLDRKDSRAAHLAQLLAEYTKEGADTLEGEAAEGVRDFLTYLATDLETDLRRYVFRLKNGRYPAADDPLPNL